MKKIPSLRWFGGLRLALLLMLIAVVASPGWARSYRISSYDATIHVDDDGSARVTEKISFVFSGQYQGKVQLIIRSIFRLGGQAT